MNDLLNEEEFIENQYNPNRWFRRFYIGAFIFEIISFTAFRFIAVDNSALPVVLGIFGAFLLPLVVSMIMVFSKKEILLDTKKSKIVKGISILQVCFIIPRLINMAIDYYYIYSYEGELANNLILLVPLASIAVLYGITLAIIIPLVNRSRKRQQSLTDNEYSTK